MDTYSAALVRVAISLLRSMSVSLGLEPEFLLNVFGEILLQSMRINYYPPCPEASKVVGLSPHSDATGLTILLQANEVPGLQIRKDGKWFTVEPLPGAFLVNVGDLVEVNNAFIEFSMEYFFYIYFFGFFFFSSRIDI